MKPPILDRIRIEDLPEAPKWFEKVLYLINRFVETVYQLFNKNLTFADNFNAQIFKTRITQNDIDVGYKIKTTVKGTPAGVIKLRIVKVTGSHEAITDAVDIDWEWNDNFIVIKNITGIDSSSSYDISLLII